MSVQIHKTTETRAKISFVRTHATLTCTFAITRNCNPDACSQRSAVIRRNPGKAGSELSLIEVSEKTLHSPAR